jgi:hypothetical protein
MTKNTWPHEISHMVDEPMGHLICKKKNMWNPKPQEEPVEKSHGDNR